MLKGIPPIISPELLKVLCEMGHGDEIVIADGNFPSESIGKCSKVVRLDGHGVPEILDAVLKLIPLDQYVDKPVVMMQKVQGDKADVSIWDSYARILAYREQRDFTCVEMLERFAFYERAKSAYAVVATGEASQYANIILKKGCVLH